MVLVSGGGGFCLTAASARPFSPARVNVLTFMALALSFLSGVGCFLMVGFGSVSMVI